MITKMSAISLAADKEKEQMHDSPLFPCSVYYSDWQKGGIESIPWHWHKELELMYIDSGSVLVELAGERTILQAGDGFFCNSRVLHRFRLVGEKCRVCYLVFDDSLISGGVGTIFYQKYISPIVFDRAFSGKFLFKKNKKDKGTIKEIQAAYTAARDEVLGFEHDIRYHLGKALLGLGHHTNITALKQLTPTMERIKEMVDYIHCHYSEPFEIDQMAFHAGVSAREAQRCFRSMLKISPKQYIQNYRLQMAEEMLVETNESILSIGLACGFSNPSHFSKAFRLYRGCSPHEYRRRNTIKKIK
ncbi:MAG: AraC family transcriptional regulator [Anaerovibrio sp.]|uniref:AraC family transcriptional regulator n=1 Tax=Anaerovibrio sp. TaxID=1872532 RepID=UPI0025FB7AED|nr:AraC family transcriptional regulator [Anaerovibrio sp.]MCR5175515.1 AraC family transcriptional regulator [Anaerovibrio sp.]